MVKVRTLPSSAAIPTLIETAFFAAASSLTQPKSLPCDNAIGCLRVVGYKDLMTGRLVRP